jgi:TonB-dependent receptor-like protein
MGMGGTSSVTKNSALTVAQGVRAAILMVCAPTSPLWAQAAGTVLLASASPSSDELQEVTVTSQRLSLIGSAQTASQGIIVQEELALVPAFRPAQVLETVPGLDVTIHSGEGKAGQYLLRGYNLDHGTDLAVFIDDMPINEPTHAHGQGYTDLNFMFPQLATDVTYTKGTYYAPIGDFGSVGSVHINYLDTIPDQAAVTVGTLGYYNAMSAGTTEVGGGHLLGAIEAQSYNGPWTIPGEQRKYNSVVRFSEGDPHDGYSVTGMFYHDIWNAQTDQPERALTEGLISSVWDQLDKTDAGDAQRASLSTVFHQTLGGGQLTANAYVISNRLTLWNDFTHFLVDPVNGDQEQQQENRLTVGGDLDFTQTAQLFGIDQDWEVGLHDRHDVNRVSRVPSEDRTPLTAEQLAAVDYPNSFIEDDLVHLESIAAYGQLTSHWTEWFRSVIGFREDYQHGSDSGTYYGTASKGIAEPKGSLIFRPAADTEVYASYGIGYHSDDLRGVNAARIEGTQGAPLIARQIGEELGLRQQLFDKQVVLTLAVFNLTAQSETEYDPDVGQDAAGPGSKRRGMEINLTYQPTHWLEFYGSYSADHVRYTSLYDDGSGHLGYYLPNAPLATGSFNVYVHDLGPWSGGLMYRYLSKFPLTSGPCADSAVQADFKGLTSCAAAPTVQGEVWGSGYGEWNADVHYTFPHGWSLTGSLYNMTDKKANSMEYYYIDRLPGEPAYGAADVHFHPLEPFSGRVTIAKQF